MARWLWASSFSSTRRIWSATVPWITSSSETVAGSSGGPAVTAILGGQVGYFIGRFIGLEMFKPDARFLKQRYLDEAHAFFEQRGPIAIVIARFVPIVRTLAPLTAGAAKMNYAVFSLYNAVGAAVWGIGLTLLGYWLGGFPIIQKLLEPIFLLIVLASIAPMVYEWWRRRKAAKAAGTTDGDETPEPAAERG